MTVSIDDNLYLDERSAGIIAGAMVSELRKEQDRAMAAMYRVKISGGNLKGLRRGIARIKRAIEPIFLASLYETYGKRCNYEFSWLVFMVSDLNVLNIGAMSMWAKGLNDPQRGLSQMQSHVTFSKHALARTIQRLDIRSSADYRRLLTAIAKPSMISSIASLEMKVGTVWPLPFSFEGRRVLLRIVRPSIDEPPIIVTALDDNGAWAYSKELKRLEALVDGANFGPNDMIQPYVDAFKAAATKVRP